MHSKSSDKLHAQDIDIFKSCVHLGSEVKWFAPMDPITGKFWFEIDIISEFTLLVQDIQQRFERYMSGDYNICGWDAIWTGPYWQVSVTGHAWESIVIEEISCTIYLIKICHIYEISILNAAVWGVLASWQLFSIGLNFQIPKLPFFLVHLHMYVKFEIQNLEVHSVKAVAMNRGCERYQSGRRVHKTTQSTHHSFMMLHDESLAVLFVLLADIATWSRVWCLPPLSRPRSPLPCR